MALETVIYPQDSTFSYGFKDLCNSFSTYDHFGLQEEEEVLDQQCLERDFNVNNWNSSSPDPNSVFNQTHHYWDPNSSPEACMVDDRQAALLKPRALFSDPMGTPPRTTGRRKRRRTKSTKNKEEIENQRMTHIVVERNRRKQMNEYLAVLRSLMPPSYVQRGDQASIIGGAINFVKELEQQLQFMKTHKTSENPHEVQHEFSICNNNPFAEFFTFPQYSTHATQSKNSANESSSSMAAKNQWAAGDIEVTMADSHANLKILSKKQPRQFLKLVAGLHGLRLSILHLNVTTFDQMVLYSISVKVEEGCHLNTSDEIAAAVNQMLHTIQEGAAFS